MESAQTPLMKQYWEIKHQHPESILLFRLGDFYEMFFEDAEKAAPILDIALTSRDKSSSNPVPLCGIPYHSATSYMAKLLDHGLSVAVCEQVEDPKLSKGLVKREVVRVITPGLRTDLEGLSQDRIHALAAMGQFDDLFALAWLDVSLGTFRSSCYARREDLDEALSQLRPHELLILDELDAPSLAPTRCVRVDEWVTHDACNDLAKRFGLAHLDGLGLAQPQAEAKVAWALLDYVERQNKTKLPHLQAPVSDLDPQRLWVDQDTAEHLGLFPTRVTSDPKACLFGVLNHTNTHAGARLLRLILAQPTQDRSTLAKRLDALEDLLSHTEVLQALRSDLSKTCDVERLMGRIASGRCFPRDFMALRETLALLPGLLKVLEPLRALAFDELRGDLSQHGDVCEYLYQAIAPNPPPLLKDGGVIREHFSAELDHLRRLRHDVKTWIHELEQRERKATGIPTLKVGYNRVFGYYVEVSKGQVDKVPPHYLRKQTLSTGERFVTPELKEAEEEILSAEEKMMSLEAALFEDVRAKVSEHLRPMQRLAKALAQLDVWASLAHAARMYDYVRPEFVEDDALTLEEARHPVVERFVPPGEFTPNSVHLDHHSQQLILLTGPNMSGKSTVMRQVGLIVLMAHLGSFVPAKRARIPRVDRIFTRVGASDDLASGKSTFMVEMSETAKILRNATRHSLILLDEIGRGTSTFDGLSIAWAVAEYLHDTVEAKTLFATHYHELTTLAQQKARVKNQHVAVKEFQGSIVFLRQLQEGPVNRSYGIAVAKLAGVLPSVLDRATHILETLEAKDPQAALAAAQRVPPPSTSRGQLTLFTHPAEDVLKELKDQDIDALSPRKALDLLYRWKNRYTNS